MPRYPMICCIALAVLRLAVTSPVAQAEPPDVNRLATTAIPSHDLSVRACLPLPDGRRAVAGRAQRHLDPAGPPRLVVAWYRSSLTPDEANAAGEPNATVYPPYGRSQVLSALRGDGDLCPQTRRYPALRL